MGQLREVQAALERKRRMQQESEIQALSAAGYVSELVSSLKQPGVKPERFEDVSRQLARGIKSLGKELDTLKSKEVGFDPVFKRIDALEGQLSSLISALNKIEIPTPELPAVNVDAPDLGPILSELAALRQDIASIQINVETPVTAKEVPQTVIFDIERTQGGYLKRVVAKAQ